MDTRRDEKILRFLQKILGAADPASLIERLGTARAGLQPGAEGATGQAAPEVASESVRKLAAGIALSPQERSEAEAIIIPDLRPAIRVVNRDYEVAHPMWRHLNDPARKRVLRPLLSSIGRIELPNHPSLPYGGTGFVVGNGLIMTNRHVAEIFASGLGRTALRFHSGLRAGIDFRKEKERDQPDYLDVTGIAMIHAYWDMALLRVSGLNSNRVPLALSLEHPEDLRTKEVAVIGYPAFDPRNPAEVQDRVFGGVYNVKRLQPGLIRSMRYVESYDRMVEAMTHDTSTLGGNSGSAVIHIETGSILGLHFGGSYLDANFGVPAQALSLDARVIDAGVKFAGQPTAGNSAADQAWRQLQEHVDINPRHGETQGGDLATPPAKATFDIPLRITVELGAPVSVPAAPGLPSVGPDGGRPTAVATEKMAEPFRERNYANRKGYDANFLGISVPLPRPRDEKLAAITNSGAKEVPYHHFSIVMHSTRRLALITGANVDASLARKRPGNRPAADYTRDGLAGLGKNDQELWFTDERLAADAQLSDRFFTKDRQSFDRGHLVRREDVAWGDTYEEMRAANGDTFHITNCSPQTAGFNRAAGKNWGALENVVLAQADTERLNVFAGPVLADGDNRFAGVEEDGATLWVPIPSRYWKVIVAKRGDTLESFGFVLEQDLSNVSWEFAVAPDWRPFMRPISAIEELTGVVFPDAVRESDQSSTPRGAEIRERAGLDEVRDTRGTGAAPVADAMASLIDDLSPIFEGWRVQQGSGKDWGTVRFTLNFAASIPDDSDVAARIIAALGFELTVEPLFEPDVALDRYRSVVIPRVSTIDQQDMFDLARLLRALSGADSVDPDLGSNYYDYDPPDNLPPAEETNVAFWCWAPDNEKPADPDWAVASTRVPEAWAFSLEKGRPEKGKGIKVFQPDTGVVANHRELGKELHLHPDAANLVEPGKPALDPMTGGSNPGHGTGTGSVVISAESGTMRGVAPLATLIPVRCIETVSVFNQSPVAKAIDHARRRGAHVITMSLGGVFSSALHAAVRQAVDANTIVIAAAGNCVGEVVWPARYAETIAVGGVNSASKPWRGSSRGASITISGPAEFVLRADARDKTDPNAVSGGQGTSFATAHLAGVAALWLAHYGRDDLIAMLPPGRRLQDMFRAVIRASAKVPTGFDTSLYGAGIVTADGVLKRNPVAALREAQQPAQAGLLDQLTSLIDGAFGGGASESAAGALADRQNYPELAAAALDRLRAGRSRRATQEAMPPTGLSLGLKRALGANASMFAKVEAGDVF